MPGSSQVNLCRSINDLFEMVKFGLDDICLEYGLWKSLLDLLEESPEKVKQDIKSCMEKLIEDAVVIDGVCPLCGGEVYRQCTTDWVPYGSTHVPMKTHFYLCSSCQEEF